jgi:hypothetical protein
MYCKKLAETVAQVRSPSGRGGIMAESIRSWSSKSIITGFENRTYSLIFYPTTSRHHHLLIHSNMSHAPPAPCAGACLISNEDSWIKPRAQRTVSPQQNAIFFFREEHHVLIASISNVNLGDSKLIILWDFPHANTLNYCLYFSKSRPIASIESTSSPPPVQLPVRPPSFESPWGNDAKLPHLRRMCPKTTIFGHFAT